MQRGPAGGAAAPRQERDELEAARGGSEPAARALVVRHGPSMMKTAWRVLGRYGPSDAEDVVQEAFVAALTTRATPESDVGAWLRAIAARKALDAMRARGRRAERPLDKPVEVGATTDGARATHDVLVVREALGRLSATDRAVLTLVDLEGLSMAEAARALGLTRVAVKLRAVRARRKLAALLRPAAEEAHGPDETR